jgi:hypothetical protein
MDEDVVGVVLEPGAEVADVGVGKLDPFESGVWTIPMFIPIPMLRFILRFWRLKSPIPFIPFMPFIFIPFIPLKPFIMFISNP